jgi:hypothetical protein
VQRYTNKNNQENFVIDIPIKNPLSNRKKKNKAKTVMQPQRKTSLFKYIAKTSNGNKKMPVNMLKIKIFNRYSREVCRVLKINDRNWIITILTIQKASNNVDISTKSPKLPINLCGSRRKISSKSWYKNNDVVMK